MLPPVELELWNIFMYYSLHGNSMDPTHLNASYFFKFCHDTFITDSVSLRRLDKMFNSVVKMRSKVKYFILMHSIYSRLSYHFIGY